MSYRSMSRSLDQPRLRILERAHKCVPFHPFREPLFASGERPTRSAPDASKLDPQRLCKQ
jgi:hypothetical protein